MPSLPSPGEESDLKPNHALEVVVGAYRAARTGLLAAARRAQQPLPPPTSVAAAATDPTPPKPRGCQATRRASAREDDTPPGETITRKPDRRVAVDRQKLRRRR